ncbi:3-alpha,7-alpha,12-alpha-trihydroxy-5-beta-cholest-24-enoyl-CoA hydratase [Azoarcus sp. DN11]|nr:3-alpha,7-alpha,12-alpha-trihydroxy-5-beta-cholest-24-enoyl-CoA hydratase [Azoarcus sp. DN11]
MLNYGKTRDWKSGDVRHSYTTKDSILYALALGVGADPLDGRQLRFIYEKELAVVPTMAAVLASPGFWMRDRAELGIDHLKIVHAEQGVRLHAALPPQGTLIGRSRVVRVVDKGAGRGAILYIEKQLYDEATQQLIATAEQAMFCRGDGGFSLAGGGDEAPTGLPPTPDRPPEAVVDLATRPDAAALYRLCGDLNPLHIDPAVAAKAGFPKPILHGLATYGMACRGLLELYCDYDPLRLRSIRGRLSAPVYPGETLRVECWREGGEVAFRVRALERNVVVLSHGRAEV